MRSFHFGNTNKPKLGTVLNIVSAIALPILFLGMGQNYSDIRVYESSVVLEGLV
ncbi:MAG: hypothetical protein ACE3JU_00430 [Paenibacillus sp.]|uniref:hypothetical protein n=1 Tax=Paenibacillus sp. TaxID=58172 RepID=UPI003B7B292C